MISPRKIIALVLVLLTVWSTAGHTQNSIIKNGQKIAFLGDSVTAQGVGPSGYAQQVIRGLAANGIKATMIGAGVGGNDSAQMLAREDADVISYKPDWMTISCGINDIWHHITLDQYKENLTKIVEKAQAANIKVIILTPTMIDENLASDMNQQMIPYVAFLHQLAKDKICPIADLNADMRAAVLAAGGGAQNKRGGKVLTLDGCHPNALGHQVMALGVLRTMGLDSDQLQNAKNSWMDLKGICLVDLKGGLTVQQLEQLDALAAKQNRPTSELIGELVAQPIDSMETNSAGAAAIIRQINPRNDKEPVRVACVGDSITFGAGLQPGQDYPTQLQNLLVTNWDVRNFGVSARTLLRQGDFPYWNEGAFTNAQNFLPAVVVILLGANDSKPHNWKYHNEFAGDYADLVNAFRNLASKPRIYVCRPTPVPQPGNYGINEATEQQQINLIDYLADTMTLNEIDLYAPLKDQPQLFPDRVHPNAEGAVAMAKLVAQALTSPNHLDGVPVVHHTVWNAHPEDTFVLDRHHCRIVLPKSFAPGKPWIWRPEFFGAYDQADQALLAKGYPIAYMDMENIFGSPPAMKLMDKFYGYLTSHYGLSAKATLFGFSRGGLYSVNWAARHPDRASCLYLDAPVCDIKSWPGGRGKGNGSPADWERLKVFYGFTNDQEALDYQHNPIDNLKPLATAKISILNVCGGADTTVPYLENTAILKQRYEAMGGFIQVIVKPGCDHHPHSLTDPKPIVDFVLKNNN
jgi:lysophospholipase L1-like esterase/pimeloyl-ACP methyl ester carboxylesterase